VVSEWREVVLGRRDVRSFGGVVDVEEEGIA
jgi:hypothetical protein